MKLEIVYKQMKEADPYGKDENLNKMVIDYIQIINRAKKEFDLQDKYSLSMDELKDINASLGSFNAEGAIKSLDKTGRPLPFDPFDDTLKRGRIIDATASANIGKEVSEGFIDKIKEEGVIGTKKLEVDEIVVSEGVDNFLSKTKKGVELPEAPKVDKVETEDEKLARELQAFIDAEAEKTRILEEEEKRRREIEESATAFSIGLQAGKNENLLEGVAILLQKELQLYIQNEVAKAGISAVGSSLIGFGVGGLFTALTGSLFGSDDNEPTNRGVTYHDAGTNSVYLDKEKVGYTIGDNKQYRERQGYETR